MTVTRFPNGVGDRPEDHPFGDMPFIDPTKTHIWFEDFNYLDADEFNVIGGGGTIFEGSAPHGIAVINLTGAADTDRTEANGTAESVTLGARQWFGARIASATGRIFTDMAVHMGVGPIYSVYSVGAPVYRGTFFIVDNDSIRIAQYDDSGTLIVEQDLSSALDVTALAAEEYFDVEYLWEPENNELHYGINGVKVGSLISTNAARIENVTLKFGSQKANANVADYSLNLDYIFSSHLRSDPFYSV